MPELTLRLLQEMINIYGGETTLQDVMNQLPGAGVVTHLDMVLSDPQHGDQILIEGECWEFNSTHWTRMEGNPYSKTPDEVRKIFFRRTVTISIHKMETRR